MMPTVLRAMCLNGSQLASYDQSKAILRGYGWEETPKLHVV